MTKTFTGIGLYFYPNLCPQKIMPFGTNIGESGVCIFEFGSLEFVWYLVLEIWNLKFFVLLINVGTYSKLL